MSSRVRPITTSNVTTTTNRRTTTRSAPTSTPGVARRRWKARSAVRAPGGGERRGRVDLRAVGPTDADLEVQVVADCVAGVVDRLDLVARRHRTRRVLERRRIGGQV